MHTPIDQGEHCTAVHRNYADCTCGWRSVPTYYGDASQFATWHRLSVGETIDNPYLRELLAPITAIEVERLGARGSEFLAARVRRDRLAAEYAWAIPTENVVRRLAELSPICDLGCGTGYWAKLLTDVGAEVLAVDALPPLEGNNHWHRHDAGLTHQQAVIRHFTSIVKGAAETFDVPSNHTLMLCWPPYDSDMAARALARYGGDRVIYIGEHGGCTADDTFHEMLAEQWTLVTDYTIPQWPGLHDAVYVYARKS